MSYFVSNPLAPAEPCLPTVEWEETDCPLCDCEGSSLVLEAPDRLPSTGGLWFAVVQCQNCGLCFTNPRPTPASIRQFYPADYRPHRRREGRPSRADWLFHTRWPIPARRPGRLLDFGCGGGGGFLHEMQCRGWTVTGLDVSETAIAHLCDKHALPALSGSLPHPELPVAQFDLITMWNSLEHVHSPRTVLEEARRLLAPGGQLVVAVPNIDSLAFRWFGPCWYGLDLPRHLSHFAPWTLHLLLERAGFRVESSRMLRRSGWLRWSARIARQSASASRWQRWLQSPFLSRLTARYTCLTQQSDGIVVTASC